MTTLITPTQEKELLAMLEEYKQTGWFWKFLAYISDRLHAAKVIRGQK